MPFNFKRVLQKDEQSISNFMFPISAVANKRKTAPAKPFQKIDEKQSKDIMNSLFDDLDQQDAEDLEQPCVAPD